MFLFFFSSRRRHTRCLSDWSSDVCSSDLAAGTLIVHDPSTLRTTEYRLESIGKEETPLGPRGMALATRDKTALLDELLRSEERRGGEKCRVRGGPERVKEREAMRGE